MNNDQAGRSLKVPIAQAQQRSGLSEADAQGKGRAALAERRPQEATGAIEDALGKSRHA